MKMCVHLYTFAHTQNIYNIWRVNKQEGGMNIFVINRALTFLRPDFMYVLLFIDF